MVLRAKLASQIPKAIASQTGINGVFFQRPGCFIPQDPISHVNATRAAKYPPRYASATAAEGAIATATSAHGSPHVKSRPKWPHGRIRRMMVIQRTRLYRRSPSE